MNFKSIAAAVISAYAVLSGPTLAADIYPTKPVTLVVPYAAGGPIDAVIRKMGEKLAEKWKVSVVIDNRPGGSEVVGAQRVLNAPADGHTIFVGGAISLTINPMTFKELSYDPNDFAAVSRLINFNMAFVVSSETPVKTFDDFVSYAKQKQHLSFGCPGSVGGLTHLAFSDVVRTTQVPLNFIPYNGLASVLQDIVGGRLDSALGGVAPLRPHIEDGKLRALAVGGNARSKLMPDVPTFAELGYDDIAASFYTALVVKVGTPEHIIQKIAKDTREIIMDPSFGQQSLDPFAIEAIADTPQEFAAYLKKDESVQKTRVLAAGIEPR